MATHDGILVLNQGVGYGIVVGIGAFFALLMYVRRLPPYAFFSEQDQAHDHLPAKSIYNLFHQAI